MSDKFSYDERKVFEQIIIESNIMRYDINEIKQFVKQKMNRDVSTSTIYLYQKKLKKGAEKWILGLRKTRYEYVYVYLERIHELSNLQKNLWQLFGQSEKIEQKIKIIEQLHGITISLGELYSAIPKIVGFIPPCVQNMDLRISDNSQKRFEDIKRQLDKATKESAYWTSH